MSGYADRWTHWRVNVTSSSTGVTRTYEALADTREQALFRIGTVVASDATLDRGFVDPHSVTVEVLP